MTPERWKKLDLLFHEALELQGEARAFHLAKVCAIAPGAGSHRILKRVGSLGSPNWLAYPIYLSSADRGQEAWQRYAARRAAGRSSPHPYAWRARRSWRSATRR